MRQALEELLLDGREKGSHVDACGDEELLAVGLVGGAEGGWLVVAG